MLIQVRVQLAQAQRQIALLQGQLTTLQAKSKASAAAAAGFSGGALAASSANLRKWGNNLQWAGRQLIYNFSIPLALAGVAATKFALDNERAMARLQKVYGDNSARMNKLAKTEIPALAKAFEALSDRFGVAQKDVINIAADWAAAGASGIALARGVKLTLETMILGELDATTATKELIAIQAQFGLQTQSNQKNVMDLQKTIDILNMVENQTGTTMKDLLDVLSRASGVARSAGIDVQHLAAMTAALVPAAGSAASAGNGLKTIISRIFAPTNQAAKVFEQLGIHLNTTAWQSKNGSQRIEELAKVFGRLSDSQKTWVATQIAGRFQVSRFLILMSDITNKNGYYQKALKSSTDQTANFRQRVKELNIVLDSNPQKLQIIKTNLQNALVNIIVPLLPAILAVANSLAKLAQSFENLNPSVQKWIAYSLAFLVVIGPIARYMGAFGLLISLLGNSFIIFGKGLLLLLTPFRLIGSFILGIIPKLTAAVLAVASFAGWWALAAVAIGVAVALIYREITQGTGKVATWLKNTWGHIVDFFHTIAQHIVDAFNALPKGIQNAFISVIQVIGSAVKEIIHLLSYLNPFAHHSPSLVEQSHAGMKKVASNYQTHSQKVSKTIQNSTQDIGSFNKSTQSIQPPPFADQRSDLSKALPSALPQFDKLVADYKQLVTLAAQANAAVAAQQKIVDKWKASLDAANTSLDKQQKKLSDLQDNLQTLQDAYSKHQDAIDAFASTGISGMRKYDNAIFDNQQAQNKLQLQILKYQQSGQSIDDLKNKMSSLAGDIEKLQGEATGLRMGGAGSDVLGPLNNQINQMQSAYSKLDKQAQNDPTAKLQSQLDKLQNQGQILDLTKSINYDPLTRQISQLTDGYKELPFKTIIDGINNHRAAQAKLTPQINAATAAVAKQQTIVDNATKARDKIQARYDAENAKLQILQDRYNKLSDAINAVTDAINNMSSAAQKSTAAAAGGTGLPPAANFADVGKKFKIGREGGLTDQTKAINDFTKQIQDEVSKAFGSFGDIFKPIKDKWNQLTTWIKQHGIWKSIQSGAGTALTAIGDAIQTIIGWLQTAARWVQGAWNNKGVQAFIGVLQTVAEVIGKLVGAALKALATFWPDVKRIFGAIGKFIGQIFTKLGPTFSKFVQQVSPLLKILAKAIGIVAGALGVILYAAIKLAADVISRTLGPVLNLIIDVLDGVMKVVGGFIDFFVNIFTGKFSKAWDDVKQIFSGAVEIMVAPFREAWGLIEGIVGGLIEWLKPVWKPIWEGIKWAWDNIGKPIFDSIKTTLKTWAGIFSWIWNNIIKAAWNALWAGIKWAWNNIAVPLFNSIKTTLKTWAGIFSWIWNNIIKAAWNAIWNGIKWIWNNVAVPVFDIVKGAIKTWAGIFSWVYDHIIGPSWRGIWAGIKWVWNNVAKPFFNGLWGGIKGAISIFKNSLETAWNGIKAIFAAPIKFLIDIVLDKGILGAWNWIAGVIPGMSGLKVKEWHPTFGGYKFAGGGVVPGFAPGSDRVPAVLSPGEGILRPEVVRDLGSDRIMRWNRDKGVQHFAGGGIVGDLNPVTLFSKFKDKYWGPVADFYSKLDSSAVGQMLHKLPTSIMDTIGGKVKGWIEREITSLGGLLPVSIGGTGQIVTGGSTPATGPDSPDAVKARTKAILNSWGWGSPLEWNSLNSLWMGESGWRWNAINPSSGAYGIPQALPPEKMDSAGADWFTNPSTQVRWGLGYIKDRYGSPANAYAEWYARNPHWYAQGGIANQPTAGIFGERGAEVLAPLDPLWNKLDSIEKGVTTIQQGGSQEVTLNFYGDLSFPNVRSGEDAESFINNLKIVAGR